MTSLVIFFLHITSTKKKNILDYAIEIIPIQTNSFQWDLGWAVVHMTAGSQKSTSSQVCEHLDDVFRHRGRSGQMIASGLESVFIGGPVDGEDNTIRRSIRVRSSGDGADIFGFRSDFLLVSALLNPGAISRLETNNIWIRPKSVTGSCDLVYNEYVYTRKSNCRQRSFRCLMK